MGFELSEGLLDRVEVWRVWRQIEQLGSGRLDGFAHALHLVAGEIIHDDDVAGVKRRNETLLDPSPEDCTVHRLVDDEGSSDGIAAQPRHEGRRLPVAVGHAADQPVSAQTASIEPGHVGGRACLIDEYELAGIKRRLLPPPRFPRGRHIGPFLFGGVHGFF